MTEFSLMHALSEQQKTPDLSVWFVLLYSPCMVPFTKISISQSFLVYTSFLHPCEIKQYFVVKKLIKDYVSLTNFMDEVQSKERIWSQSFVSDTE